MSTERIQGTVKWFNRSKGYGFIKPDDDSQDVFVHMSNIVPEEGSEGTPTLWEDDKVEYEIGEGRKGPEAHNVVVTEKGPREPKSRPPRSGGGGYGGNRGGYGGNYDAGFKDRGSRDLSRFSSDNRRSGRGSKGRPTGRK